MSEVPRFSQHSLLVSGKPEERVAIAFSMLDAELVRKELEELFLQPLNWPVIVMQTMHHRTLCMQWDTMKRLDLVRAACRSGLTKNWIAYFDQLSRASHRRNSIWMDRLEWIFEEFEKASVPIVCIKGGALIGDLYDQHSRMLGDIDTLIRSEDRKIARELLFDLGFKHGTIDPISRTIMPLSRANTMFWNLYAHVMPKFTLELNDPDCPFLRFAVGLNFFDQRGGYSYPSEPVIARRVRKSQSRVWVPDATDTIVNLCVHIFREARSATMGYMGENWNLWKFCDFRSKLLQLNAASVGAQLKERLVDFGLQRAFCFALHYTDLVYGDADLLEWRDLFPLEKNSDYLYEIVDGERIVRFDRPFSEQLFSTTRVAVPGLQPVWSKVMSDAEWW